MITRSIAIVPAVVVAVSSTSHLDTLDEWLNVVQSIQYVLAVLHILFLFFLNGDSSNITILYFLREMFCPSRLPFALLPLIIFSQDINIMQEFKMGRVLQISVWIIFVVVLGINVYLVQNFAASNIASSGVSDFVFVVMALAYFGFLLYLMYKIGSWLLIAP